MELLSQRILERIDEFAELMAREISKPVMFGRGEVERIPEMLSAISRRYSGHAARESAPAAVSVRRRPHGVVAVITPWNNPLYIPLGKIIPAILHGNAVVWKPAPQARRISRLVAECLGAAGWPLGLVTVLEGGRTEAEQLLHHPQVAAATLTGSLAAGTGAQEICGRRLIPFQAELGGNNAAVVWRDADLSLAGRLIAAGAFDMAGQRCTANRRVIVYESCRDELLEQLRLHASALVWGDPLNANTRIGPVVSARQYAQIADVVARAESSCDSLLRPLGANGPDTDSHNGAWFPPVIVCCGDPGHEIVQEETFGPVLVIQTARDWKQAMRLCNGVRQGLSAAVFTRSRDVADRFLDEAQAGMLKVNQSTSDAAVDAPFGGWKASGIGPPEHGIFDLEFFTRPQTVYDELREDRSDDFR